MRIYLRSMYNRWSYLVAGIVSAAACVLGLTAEGRTPHILGVLLGFLCLRNLIIFADLTRQKPSL